MERRDSPLQLARKTALTVMTIVLALCFHSCGCGDEAGSPAAASRPASDFSGDVATRWYRAQLEFARETVGWSPPVVGRTFGYTGIALYESVVAGMDQHRSLVGQVTGLNDLPAVEEDAAYYWPAVANTALAQVTRRLFGNLSAENHSSLDSLENALQSAFLTETSAEAIARSEEFGFRLANGICAWAITDHAADCYDNNFPPTYAPPTGPGRWMPTPPDYTPALQPYWGLNRPMAMSYGGEFTTMAPPIYSEDPGSVFYQQAKEVYDTVNNLTEEQRQIAAFWADDGGRTSTPGGHWISILTQHIEARDLNLAVAAEAYARLGIAICDAFICCWHTKYEYCLLRPITYIHNTMDAHWSLEWATPPFPEYTSGHSVQSSAAAQALTDMFGIVAFTDHTHDRLGLPARSYASFKDAADEAMISRLYGGIHYRAAIEDGAVQGRQIAAKVNALRFHR